MYVCKYFTLNLQFGAKLIHSLQYQKTPVPMTILLHLFYISFFGKQGMSTHKQSPPTMIIKPIPWLFFPLFLLLIGFAQSQVLKIVRLASPSYNAEIAAGSLIDIVLT